MKKEEPRSTRKTGAINLSDFVAFVIFVVEKD